tara:strand:+ start:11933 stop:12706 length:774 start_codon:yes stop_codon:yes gene_type:complete
MTYLKPNDIEKFNHDGFLVKQKFFDDDEIFEIRKWVYQYAEKKPEDWKKGQEMGYYETSLKDGNRILTRLENFVNFNKKFHDLVYSPKIIDSVEDLLGEKCVLFKEKINFKNPGGSGFKPHQDAISRWDDYASDFMNVLVCTDKGTLDNGCLEVAAGFHDKGLLGPYDAPIPDEYLKKMDFQPLQHMLGDVVFFNSFTPHQSQENKTELPRTNIYLTYSKLSQGDHREKYFTRKRKELPPDNERNGDFKDSPLHNYK